MRVTGARFSEAVSVGRQALHANGADPSSRGGAGGIVDANDDVVMAAALESSRAVQALPGFGTQAYKATTINQDVRLMIANDENSQSHVPARVAKGVFKAILRSAMCWHVEGSRRSLHGIEGLSDVQGEEGPNALRDVLLLVPNRAICSVETDYPANWQPFVMRELERAGASIYKHITWDVYNLISEELCQDRRLFLNLNASPRESTLQRAEVVKGNVGSEGLR